LLFSVSWRELLGFAQGLLHLLIEVADVLVSGHSSEPLGEEIEWTNFFACQTELGHFEKLT